MALNNIYLLKFNNYFNRRVKKLGSAGDYIAQAVFATRNTAFNYNDGVQAEQVINSEVGCDYVVVTDPSDAVIVSRWFVI